MFIFFTIKVQIEEGNIIVRGQGQTSESLLLELHQTGKLVELIP